ncbi:MAG TPA: PEP-CTERM sorting domain-containing protein [Candidatus Eisenbacteria bacterium]|nr:PEP-CTERM sorting domain-containing protein [Candidatus Eisenbacteria bacterium]
MHMKRITLLVALAAIFLAALPAGASLTVFQQYVGDYGYAQSGCGSVTQFCTINIDLAGTTMTSSSTITAAYLYSAEYSFIGPFTPDVSLNGTNLGAPTVFVPQSPSCCGLASARWDVTGLVQAQWNGGAGNLNFNINENSVDDPQNAGIDGEALVIVYNNGGSTVNTVAILDGYSTSAGDSSFINFSSPLNGFAQMSIADSFSCCGQASSITVNGTTITDFAGNNDDSQDAFISNGNLITSGGPGSPYPGFSPCLPDYASDHERYDLVACAGVTGATNIRVDTLNPSGDDNIFEETFWVSGQGTVTTTPEPATLAMFGSGVLGLAGLLRRKFDV